MIKVSFGYEQEAQETYNPWITNILKIMLCVLALLVGMKFVHFYCDGIVASILNILVMDFCLYFALRAVRIQEILECNVISATLLICSVIAIFNIIFSANFVFSEYLSGASTSVSYHGEHSLMFSEMETIATRLAEGLSLEEATAGLPLNQYYYIFVYSSMIFLFGGVNVTNMCVWAMFHTALCPIFVTLSARCLGINESKKLRTIYYITLLQPLFLCTFAYNKVIIGEAFLMLAIYIYMSTFRNPIKNMLAFPLYAFLFWAMRYQYLIFAVILLVVCIIHSGITKRSLFSLAVFLAIFALFAYRINIFEYIFYDLNVSNYTEGADLSLSSLPVRVIRSFLPIFPWTNLVIRDDNWSYDMFCIFQIVLNDTLWFMLISEGVISKRFREIFSNPMIIAAVLFLASGMFSDLHTTYLSVGTMLIATGIDDLSSVRIKNIVMIITFTILVASIIYEALGLSGSGSMYINM